MAYSDSRPSSSASSSSHASSEAPENSTHDPVAVPTEALGQETQSPSEGNSQTAEGSVEVKWTVASAAEYDLTSSAILE